MCEEDCPLLKIRTLKPEILDDEIVAGLSDTAWRLFVSGIVLSDDHGNLRAAPRALLGKCWWARAPQVSVDDAVAELMTAGLWQLYDDSGQSYAHINGWHKHQRIDNASQPQVPLPPGWQVRTEHVMEGTRKRTRVISFRTDTDMSGQNRNDAATIPPGETCRGDNSTSTDGGENVAAGSGSGSGSGRDLDLAPDEEAVLSGLMTASDLWGGEDPVPVAKRIAMTLRAMPEADPVPRVQIGIECATSASYHRGKFPHATPQGLLDAAASAMKWITRDIRDGRFRPKAQPQTADQQIIADADASEKALERDWEQKRREDRARARSPTESKNMAELTKQAIAKFGKGKSDGVPGSA